MRRAGWRVAGRPTPPLDPRPDVGRDTGEVRPTAWRGRFGRAWRALAVGTTRTDDVVLALVLLLTLVDAAFFSGLGTLRYLSHNADAFDLGIEDQAMWSTLHGKLFGITLERRLTTSYLGYHVEPISLIGPLLYLLYPSPISLIVVKNVLLALGGIPAFWLARTHLGSRYAGLVFALAYWLFPGLESAALYDFHAYTLTAPFLLAAFCFLEARRYGWLLVFLALAAATKENAPLDAVPLGLYLAVVRRRYCLGVGAMVAGVVWFGIATYLIVPSFNAEGQGWLWTRYGGMGGSPLGMLRYFWERPDLLLAPVPEDPNWKYLARLVAPVAGLTLLSPTALFLMLPALAVNVLTTYEPMHLIETYHYSAHLVPFVLLGAIDGMGTIAGLAKRAGVTGRREAGLVARATESRTRMFPSLPSAWALGTIVLVATLVYHHYRGYTPLSGEFVGYPLTPHDRLGNQLADELNRTLPLDLAVSAQSNQYPHLSHRPNIWMFPEVDTAEVIVLDLATLPNTTGIDEGIHEEVRRVLDSGAFGPVTAVDGYLILRRGEPPAPLPDEFYSFARASSPGPLAGTPSHPLDVQFGDALELLGFDVIPGRDGKVNLRVYWRARRALAADLFLPFYITDGRGHEVGAALHRQPANFWYPTNRWAPGEIVQITTYNLPIGRRGQDFGIALGAQPSPNPWETAGRLRPVVRSAPAPLRTPGQGALLEVVTFRNDHDLLTEEVAPFRPAVAPARALDLPFDEGITLAGYRVAVEEGRALKLTLLWAATGATATPYTVFAHLLDRQGKLVAQSDSQPAAGLKATTAWLAGETVVDEREIPLPRGITPADTRLEIGLYDPATGRRLRARIAGQTVDHVELPTQEAGAALRP